MRRVGFLSGILVLIGILMIAIGGVFFRNPEIMWSGVGILFSPMVISMTVLLGCCLNRRFNYFMHNLLSDYPAVIQVEESISDKKRKLVERLFKEINRELDILSKNNVVRTDLVSKKNSLDPEVKIRNQELPECEIINDIAYDPIKILININVVQKNENGEVFMGQIKRMQEPIYDRDSIKKYGWKDPCSRQPVIEIMEPAEEKNQVESYIARLQEFAVEIKEEVAEALKEIQSVSIAMPANSADSNIVVSMPDKQFSSAPTSKPWVLTDFFKDKQNLSMPLINIDNKTDNEKTIEFTALKPALP